MSTSAPLLAVLDQLLYQEVDAYEELLRLQQEAQPYLAAPALNPLLDNLQAREHLARHLTRLEHQRTTVLTQLAPLFPQLATPLTLAQLSAQVEEPYHSHFVHYRTQLRRLLEVIQQLNSTQASLLTEARTFVETALAFLARCLPVRPTYQPSGQLPTPTQGRLLSGRI